MIHDLYTRAHIVVPSAAGERGNLHAKRSRAPKNWPEHALVWDTETTLDLEQQLTFGVWRFCQLQGDEFVSTQEGIFHRDNMDRKDVDAIQTYARRHSADLLDAETAKLTVVSRTAFVERILWGAVRAGALIVGFNLPFDIARIALRWTAAHNGGFSFVLSLLDAKGYDNPHRPRIRIAPLNGVAQRIELTAVLDKREQERRWRNGRFLDLHTLAFALTDNSYTLAGALKAFGSPEVKLAHEPSGVVSEAELSYGRQDVRATVGLLNALKREYDLHPIELPPDRAYSPASIGKAYLRAMGIVEPMQKFSDIPPATHGIAMAAYFGGRAEARIRRWPVPVVPVDVTSEYPSVDALLGVFDMLTAERLSVEDATEDVQAFLAKVTLDDLFRPETWRSLNFYARILPDGDILPVRSVYGSESGTRNIGLNELHSREAIWVAGPDLVASVLLSGHRPTIQNALRVVPCSRQARLVPVSLRGAVKIDPSREDFFTRAIEYRKLNKANDRLQQFLKILANSTSYGTYLELNPVKVDPRSRPKIRVYSGEHEFEQPAPDTIEQPGRFYFPPLGALITAGGRLLLAMIECCVRGARGTYLCCDTDSLIIVASESGGQVKMPNGAPAIHALTWSEVAQIARRFDSLSPYNRTIVPHLLRLTDDNFDGAGKQRQLFGLAIAAKRYVLYRTKCGRSHCAHRGCIAVINPKAHGLIFVAPDDARENGLPKWWSELWRFLLGLEFRQILNPSASVVMVGGRAVDAGTTADVDGQPSWMSLPAMFKMRMSTPHYLKQMRDKASPFGFVLHPRTRGTRKLTLLTPFSRNRAEWARAVCVNTHDGEIVRLDELSRPEIVTLGDVLCGYILHPEVKSLGPDGKPCKAPTRGLLRRMSINAGLLHFIGKEVSRFEQGKDDFIENIDDACIHYDGGRVAANEGVKEEVRARGLRRTTRETGLDRKTIRAVLNGERVKPSTLAKVVAGIRRTDNGH